MKQGRVRQRAKRRVTVTALVAASLVLLAGAPAAAAPPPSDPAFLLVGGTGSGALSVLREQNGRLSRVGAPMPIEAGTLAVAVSPRGRYVYVAHTISGTLQGWRLSGSGTLTRLPHTRIVPGKPVVGAVVSPDGRRLFVTSGGVTNAITSYLIAPDGSLRATGETSIPGATSGLSIPTVSPDGRFVFAPSFIGATMNSFRVGSDGSLHPVGPTMRTGDRPALPSVTPDGRFLYITNEGTNDISGWSIASDGTLRSIGTVATKVLPHGMAISADSRYLYLPQTGGPGVSGFRIGGDGTLTALPSADAPSPAGHFPGRVVLSPDGKWLYVIDTLTVSGTEKVFTYRVEPGGRLAPTGWPAVDTGVVFSDGATGVFVTA
ncbi:beta-propeller fold lactonase family protein [Gordonia sp. TBRC 11910]|uniref:Beta-propeller fold lactonase family protein n=1 Tax=Gordonia asplenii TaxID=2725283 RepID=A0A848KWT0_9ACTN|nr:beta-propeller fold lactonase family protein [Gordonia asplenii]NMO03070.1 beta-propeller fold lactonase family protein [Gordonia asplenii]